MSQKNTTNNMSSNNTSSNNISPYKKSPFESLPNELILKIVKEIAYRRDHDVLHSKNACVPHDLFSLVRTSTRMYTMASPFLISQYNAYNRFNQGAPSSKLMSYAEVLLRNPQIRRNARFLKFSWLDIKTNAVQMFNPLTSSDVKIDPSLRKAYRMAVRAIQDFTGTSSHDVRNGSMSSSLLLPFLLLLTPRLETLDLQFVRSSWWQNDLYVLKAF